MTMHTTRLVFSLLLAVFLASCGTEGSPTESLPSGPPTTNTTEPDLTTLPAKPSPTTPGFDSTVSSPFPATDVQTAEAGAVKALSSWLEIPEDAIDVVSAERVTWNDGSLGCPSPGRSYTQALVPGYRVLLEHDGSQYAFHGADNRPMTYCPNPSPGFNPDA
jgi:hypothetical protein